MSQALCISNYDQQADRLAFFQEMILSGLRYWQEHAAFQNMDVALLDRERESILNALTRGLEFDPAWPQVLKLIDRLASYMERRGYWTAWRSILELAIATSKRVGDIQGETTMTALLARLSQRQSRGEDVVRYYRRAMRLAKQSDNQYEYARSCCNLGYYYIDASRWWRAEVLSLRALEIFEELGSDHGRAHTHNHLGILYDRQERAELAERHLKSACEIWEKNRDDHSLIHGLTNLGHFHIEQQQAGSALACLLWAEKVAEQTGETSAIARIWNNMAFAYRIKNDWGKAEHFALKAESRFQEHSNTHQLALVWHNLGLIMIGKGDTVRASHYLSSSLGTHRKLNNHVLEKLVMTDLAKCGTFDREA